MKIPKTSLLACAFLFSASQIHAQLRVPVTNNDLRNNLQKVIVGFTEEMNAIKGEVLAQNPQTVEYSTQLKFEGAEENTVTQYISKKPIYSWQAVILTTEDFEEATKKYKWLFNQLKVMTIKMGDGYTFSLNGNYDAPDDSKKFSASTFQLTPAATYLPKLKIEVGLQYYFPEWKVNLTVYQKEREDRERGDVNED
jgi:hypothetical protein